MIKTLLPTFSLLLILAGSGQPAETETPDQGAAQSMAQQETAAAAAAQIDAQALTQKLLLIDTHIDVPYRLHDEWEDVSSATREGDFDYPREVAGGLDAMFMSIYIPADVDARGVVTGFADALIRAFSSIFSIAALGIGCLWILYDADSQAWHDRFAGTYVVKVPRHWPL